jgi:hypothetical protein
MIVLENPRRDFSERRYDPSGVGGIFNARVPGVSLALNPRLMDVTPPGTGLAEADVAPLF